MKSSTQHPLHYHTWRDLGGSAGLCLDALFFVLVLIAAACMLCIGSVLILVDYATAPVLSLMSRCAGRLAD